MQLNKTQRKIILSGIAVIVLMGLFPPWTYTYKSESKYSENPAGYCFIASPPSRQGSSLTSGIKIDMSRLFIQWTMSIAAAVFGALLTTTRKDEQNC